MYYHVTLWKEIKDNNESKNDTQTIMGFAHKTGFGVTKLQLQPDQQDVQQYYPEPQQPEPEVDPQ